MKLNEIQGIGAAFEKKLNAMGITSVEGLLDQGSSPAGRKKIADGSEISPKVVLRCVNHADLFRIKGVDTVKELAGRRADNLSQKMISVNENKNLVNKVPSESQVTKWVDQAKELPRVVKY